MPQAFHLYPAIDLKDGQAVRLLRGEMDTATVFNADPAAQAAAFRTAGFTRLHVVDLNGAFEGRSINESAVRAILAASDVPVQLGGGLRQMADVARWLEAGVGRVILGTAAVKDPDLVKTACRDFPGRVVVGIDARSGKVAVEGWAEVSSLDSADLARRFEDCGVAAIVYTDIDRDGALQGVNVDATAALAATISIPVIASGGVAALDDISALQAAARALPGPGGIDGTIIGRALYDGRIDPAQAIALVSGASETEAAC